MVIEKPLVMGIINVTNNSFYDGHLDAGLPSILRLAGQMLADGADMLDIGGQSTKPGSRSIGADEEMNRVVPVIKSIKKAYPDVLISVDTYHAEVAKAAVNAGASIVNDVSGGNWDSAMISVVAALKVPYICMHMKGVPETMQNEPKYDDVVKEVLQFFAEKTAQCTAAGITDLILDPGFGFGKTIQHNFSLLKNLNVFNTLNKPLLAGISRKSTIYKTLGVTANEALNGTTVLNTMALMNGASILRVHDVKEAKESVELFSCYKNA